MFKFGTAGLNSADIFLGRRLVVVVVWSFIRFYHIKYSIKSFKKVIFITGLLDFTTLYKGFLLLGVYIVSYN